MRRRDRCASSLGAEPGTCSSCDETVDERSLALITAIESFEEALDSGCQPSIDVWCKRFPEAGDDLRDALVACLQLHGAATSSVAAATPEKVGRHVVLGTLGRGGMGVVLRCLDGDLNREVAVKLLPASPSRTHRLRRRFHREARAMARIRHPNVLPILDVGFSEGTDYIVMELMQHSLADLPAPVRCSSHPGSVDRILAWFAQAATGLSHLHAQGVIHRDVKPSNLLVGDDGFVRVADFGLAASEGEPQLTRASEAVGTAAYAAPEQLRGAPPDPRSDIHALAASLLHVLTGRLPPPPGEPLPPMPGTPARLRPLLRRCLSPSARRRPADARLLALELEELRRPHRLRAMLRIGLLALAAALVLLAPERHSGDPSHEMGAAALPRRAPPNAWARVRSAEVRAVSWSDYPVDPWLKAYRASGGSWEALSGPPTDSAALTFPLAGNEVTATLETQGSQLCLALHAGDRRVAFEVIEFPADVSGAVGWRWRADPIDVDRDGILDLVVTRESDVAVVRWAWEGLVDPSRAWSLQLPRRLMEGSPTVLDWNGDGRLEVLVADSGFALSSGRREMSSLHEIDVESGRSTSRWALSEHDGSASTPRARRRGDGTVLDVFVDLERADKDLGGSLVRLRARDASATVLEMPTGSAGRFTWPEFVDIDGDGDPEIVVARYAGFVHCFKSDGELLWTYSTESKCTVAPIACQQDDDPAPEACVMTRGRVDHSGSPIPPNGLTCLNVEPGLDEAERIAWHVELPDRTDFFNRVVDLGDLNGDGLAELAVGAEAKVYVFSRAVAGGVLASLEAPGFTHPQGRRAPTFTARPAVAGRSPGSVDLIAMTTTGWLLGWRVGLDSRDLAWALHTRPMAHEDALDVTASPQVLRVLDVSGKQRRGVLVLAGHLYWFDLGLIGFDRPRLTWSSWAPVDSYDGTPAWWTDANGHTSIVFTRRDGLAVRVPLLLPAEPPRSRTEREEPATATASEGTLSPVAAGRELPSQHALPVAARK